MAKNWATRNNIDRKRWAKHRQLILDRDGYRCQICGKAGRLEVDHITPLGTSAAHLMSLPIQGLYVGAVILS